jgi:DNA-directed RNA polymerase specialized sigma24 family protein
VNVPPLNRRKETGELYQRSPAVEQQIQSLSQSSPAAIADRAQQSDEKHPNYIRTETLIYWIRQYLQEGQAHDASILIDVVSRRCAPIIYARLGLLNSDDRQQAAQDVLMEILALLVDQETDRADVLQVSCLLVVKRKAINAFNRYAKAYNRGTPLSALANEDEDGAGDFGLTENNIIPGLTHVPLNGEDRVLLDEGLQAIDEPYRTAFIQHHAHGWPIESNDPQKETISRFHNKDPRTIRNWLKRAEDALREWRKEEQ